MKRNAKDPTIAAIDPAVLSQITILLGDIAILKAQIAVLSKAAEPVDAEAVNGFDEEFMIGLWLADQRAAGVKTIDLDKVEVIREGMRYALELRSPAD